MRIQMPKIITIFLVLTITLTQASCKQNESYSANQVATPEGLAVATFAGGCFWCMEPPFEKLEGVHSVISGYSGGLIENPSYKAVSSGATKHREVVQIHFNPEKVDYKTLLDTFWMSMDPTDEGGQFADRGFQYTTAIFYHNDKQRLEAEQSKQELSENGPFNKPIVTPIIAYTNFFAAEEYHQDFYKKNPSRYNGYRKGSGRAGFLHRTWK